MFLVSLRSVFVVNQLKFTHAYTKVITESKLHAIVSLLRFFFLLVPFLFTLSGEIIETLNCRMTFNVAQRFFVKRLLYRFFLPSFHRYAKLIKHHFPAKWVRLSCHHTRTVSLSISFCCRRLPNVAISPKPSRSFRSINKSELLLI